jgi:hypothetical protein
MKRWRVEVNGNRVVLYLGSQRTLILPAREARRWARAVKPGGQKRERVTLRINEDLALSYTREGAQALAHRIIAALNAYLIARKAPSPEEDPEPTGPDPDEEEPEKEEEEGEQEPEPQEPKERQAVPA